MSDFVVSDKLVHHVPYVNIQKAPDNTDGYTHRLHICVSLKNVDLTKIKFKVGKLKPPNGRKLGIIELNVIFSAGSYSGIVHIHKDFKKPKPLHNSFRVIINSPETEIKYPSNKGSGAIEP